MSNLEKKITVVHIVGTGRNGSTLLERVLNEIPDFFAIGEFGWTNLEKMENFTCRCGKKFQVCSTWSVILKEDDFQKIDKKRLTEGKNKYNNTRSIIKFSLKKERSSKWKKDDLYSGFMFHGSSLQGVSSMESCGDNGATAKLRAMPIQGLFSTDAIPQFLSDPVVLDAAGQVIAYWTSDYLEKAYHIFPFRLESLQLYGESLRVPEEALCRAKIDLVEDTLLRSDIDIVAS